MDKTFDELFDDFFKRNNIDPKDEMGKELSDTAKKMIEMLKNFGTINNIEENNMFENEIDAELGEPDSVEFFQDGDMYFEKRTWNTPDGELIKITGSDNPDSLRTSTSIEDNLELLLEEAVKNEDYEKAAVLRDKLKDLSK